MPIQMEHGKGSRMASSKWGQTTLSGGPEELSIASSVHVHINTRARLSALYLRTCVHPRNEALRPALDRIWLRRSFRQGWECGGLGGGRKGNSFDYLTTLTRTVLRPSMTLAASSHPRQPWVS